MLKGESFLIRSNIILQHCTRLTKHLVAAKAVSCAAVLRSVCLTDTQQHRLYTIYSCDLTDIVGNKSLQPHLSRVSVLIPFCGALSYQTWVKFNFVAGRSNQNQVLSEENS